MSIPGSALTFLSAASGASEDYKISRSLRFNSADSAYLSKNFASAGDRQTWTWSGWFKLSDTGTQYLFTTTNASLNAAAYLYVANSKLTYWDRRQNNHGTILQTNRVFRDTFAWYHIVLSVDYTNTTSTDRARLYVNGVRETSFLTADYPNETEQSYANAAVTHYIGAAPIHMDAYLADVHFIDGQALAQTDFGEYDDNNVWQPKDCKDDLTYGTNGFHLDFSDNSSTTSGSNAGIGKDVSGNGNYWDSSNIDPRPSITGFNFDPTSTPFTDIGTGLAVTNYNGTSTVTATSNSFNLTNVADFTYTNTPANDNHLYFATHQTVPTNYTFDYYYRLDSNTQPSNASVIDLGGERLRDYGGQTSRTIRLKDTNNVHTDYSYTVAANSWNHVRVSPTGIWINGAQLNSSPRNISGTSGALNIGSYGSSASFIINGQVGPVRIAPKDLGAPPANGLVANSDGTLTTQSVANSGCDSMIDSPTNYEADSGNNGGNYCTMNPLIMDQTNAITSNGNLHIKYPNSVTTWEGNLEGTNYITFVGTMGLTTGKWYFEAVETVRETSTESMVVGVVDTPMGGVYYVGSVGNGIGYRRTDVRNGLGASQVVTSSMPDFSVGDVIGVALDLDNGKIYFSKNGTYINSGDPVAGTGFLASGLSGTFFPAISRWSRLHSIEADLNFGQRPFNTSAPSGYKAICTTNLPTPTIANGSDYFDALAWSGDGNGSRDFSGLSFQPDLTWAKIRTQSYTHILFDSVRGAGSGKELQSNSPNDEGSASTDVSGYLSAFNSDGFSSTAGSTDNDYFNKNGNTYVAWNWDAGANSNKTYNVTVVSDSGNKYRFDGHGTSAVTLDLEEGSTYVFDSSDSSVDSHPFVIGTSANSNEYSTGVTYTLDGVTKTYSQYTSGFAAATTRKLTITVPSGAPTLYYWCSAHSGMGGQINTNSTAGATVLSGSIQKYDQSQTWSGDVTGTAYSASYPKTNAFDGNLETRSVGDTNGLTFTPPSAITVNTSLRIWVDYADSSATNVLVVNGTDYSSLLTVTGYDLGWITIPNISSITSIAYGKAPSGAEKCSISAIEVDGAILVDSNLTPPAIPSISSTVRANPSAGFSIVKSASENTGGTIGHGLNATPSFVIGKALDVNVNWAIWHQGLTGTDYFIPFTYGAELAAPTTYNGFNSSTLTIGNNWGAASEKIFYCWAEVEGYSKFGSYTGDGSTTGGEPFVYTGFKPGWLMVKALTGSSTYDWWFMWDTARETYNTQDTVLYANSNVDEDSGSTVEVDILSNGFRLRCGSYQGLNEDGTKYIYMAFAEHPFKYARAR